MQYVLVDSSFITSLSILYYKQSVSMVVVSDIVCTAQILAYVVVQMIQDVIRNDINVRVGISEIVSKQMN